MRPETKNAGAALERQAIRAKLQRTLIKMPSQTDGKAAISALLDWLNKRINRYDAKAGGLGKKKGEG